MLPTLNANRDFLIVSTKYKHGRGVQVGDLVSVFKPTSPTSRVCKRITGMPGDYILIDPSRASIATNMNHYLNDLVVRKKAASGADYGDLQSQLLSQQQQQQEQQQNQNQNQIQNQIQIQQLLSDHQHGKQQCQQQHQIRLAGLANKELDQLLDVFEETLPSNTTYSNKTSEAYDQYIKVPEGHCWITGDNLSNSLDSRTYNVVPLGLITGKIVAGIYVENSLVPWTWKLRKLEDISVWHDKEAFGSST